MNPSVISLLLIILFTLMVLIGGERGIKSFMTLICNFIIFFITFIFIALTFNAILVTFISCIVICTIMIFFVNGYNEKTIASFISVLIITIITMLIISKMGVDAKIYGFSKEQLDSISSLSYYVKINFPQILVCEILVGLLAAIIDASISVSTAMNEVYVNNKQISKQKLFASGINVGKDILGTTANTLFFAYISGSMALVIYFFKLDYSIPNIINNKLFCSEIFQMLSTGIGILLIIPITAYITTEILFSKNKWFNFDEESSSNT